ncbi:MAG: rRNA methyltransferase [Candidatus Altiarchaeales archaeon ex4484_2]|nr:MAG: rRNA methyltransferase [Candidatus Altiarchaeales archaeon ex4484_2]
MSSFSVVLVESKYEGNVGSVARVMKNFGFQQLVLVNPPKLGGEARARAMHAQDILKNARVVDSFRDMGKEFDFLAGTTSEAGADKNHLRNPVFPEELVNALDSEGEIALVFGREEYGLLNEELKACEMNLAVSVAVILYEISRQRTRREYGKLKKFQKADRIEKNVLLDKYNNLVDCVHNQDFNRRLAKKTFKQVMGRAFISGREAFNLTGVFRKATERIKKRE